MAHTGWPPPTFLLGQQGEDSLGAPLDQQLGEPDLRGDGARGRDVGRHSVLRQSQTKTFYLHLEDQT